MESKQRYLVTTADERTWKFDRPVLFLGEWCRLYSRRHVWRGLDQVVLPHRWSDQQQLRADYSYLKALYERLIAALAARLNEIHGLEKPPRYWRILVGPWLIYFVQIVFDRWTSISSALAGHALSGTTLIDDSDESMVPRDMGHFCELFQRDDWNHHIYKAILEHLGCFSDSDLSVVTGGSQSPGNVQADQTPTGVRQRLFDGYTIVAGYLGRSTDAFVAGTYLPLPAELKLQACMGQMPSIWRPVPWEGSPVDLRGRVWASVDEGTNAFEHFLVSLLPRQIPTAFLEGFHSLLDRVQAQSWPKAPKLMFSSNALWGDPVTTAYVAEHATRGAPLVYGQHGGVYGVAAFSTVEDHEIAVADRYLTWGWDDVARTKVLPSGMVKMPVQRRGPSNPRSDLLLVTLEEPRYPYALSSETMVMFEGYIENCFSFADALPHHARGQLVVRLSGRDQGWNQAERWRDTNPEIRLDLGGVKITTALERTRLAVYTYNSTGFLEAFAANVPAVLFWDPRVSTLRESAVPYYDVLKRAGILHETPESAARHIGAIWHDVDAWWSSVPVREALSIFRARYCHLPPDYLARLAGILREVSAPSASLSQRSR